MKYLNKIQIIIFLFIGLLLGPSVAFSQDEVPPHATKKSWKAFQKAVEAFQVNDFNTCEEELAKVIEESPGFPDAYILQGDLDMERGKPEEAIVSYKRALENHPEKPEVVISLLANVYFSLERYHEAVSLYDSLLSGYSLSQDWRKLLVQKRELGEFRAGMMDNPVAYIPQNLGKNINTQGDEYVNALSADEQLLIFTRRTRRDNVTGGMQRQFTENFFTSRKDGGQWQIAELMKDPIRSQGDAGGLCISPDGRYIYFTACSRDDSYGSCDLYYVEKTGNSWSAPQNLGQRVNSESWDTQPSISPDGKTLYFASSRKGGYGGSDIWKTERAPDGEWTAPVNLGNTINTSESEMAPFIHYDNRTLYFSSRGHMGMGGTDLFKSQYDGTRWSEPVNLGYPLNTGGDELVVFINPDGRKGYISADIEGGFGNYDIYDFETYDLIRPQPVTYFKGIVYDADDRKPLEARIELIDIDRDSVVMTGTSDPSNGEYLVCIPADRNYALNVERKGYLFFSGHFALEGKHTGLEPFTMDIPLQPVRVGKSMVLENIFFDTDQYALLGKSLAELNKLVDFLEANLGLGLEIGGHTDNVGTEEYNLELSKRRAMSVYDYLVNNGIDKERLSYKGYGYTEPLAPNDTEEGRALNRRTEISITSLDRM